MPEGGDEHRDGGAQRFDREASVDVRHEPPLNGHVPVLQCAAEVGHFRVVLVDVVHRLEVVRRFDSLARLSAFQHDYITFMTIDRRALQVDQLRGALSRFGL